jgi:hypothetical protein
MLFPQSSQGIKGTAGQKWTENLVYLIKDKKGKPIEE